MQHDITHCKERDCPLKENCYRYIAHKDLENNPGKYGLYHSYFITSPHNYGKCKHFIKADES